MPENLLSFFSAYPEDKAPFLHQQFHAWKNSRPLLGLDVLHHVPLVPNTLLKIACLVSGGAKVVVSNPDFMPAHPKAIQALQAAGIPYLKDLSHLRGKDFDLYFDCGAALYQKLGPPRKGAVELTASGDQYYRQHTLSFPVVSIDQTYTKQLETVFGSAESASQAIAQLTQVAIKAKSWMIFGFGKIGRGLAHYCVKNQIKVMVVDVDKNARDIAQSFSIKTINPRKQDELHSGLLKTDIVVTATGKSHVLSDYPKSWFEKKILVNMGIVDEYGPQFHVDEVLNHKLPVNFILEDPTPIQYIDPALFAHNMAALQLLNHHLDCGVHTLSKKLDQEIIAAWCQHQKLPIKAITAWFVQ